MKKLILFSREDKNDVGFEYFESRIGDGFTFIAIDSPGIGLSIKEKLSFIIIDELIGNERLINARKDASKLEHEWFLPFQHILSSNGICWPKFDREAMYWFWRDLTIANQIADKLKKDGDKILHLVTT